MTDITGMRRNGLRRLRLTSVALIALAAGVCLTGEETESARPRAIVAELDGIIHPVAAEFFADVIAESDTTNADIVVIVLRTPGGLLESTRTIVSRMITSRAPGRRLRRSFARTRMTCAPRSRTCHLCSLAV